MSYSVKKILHLPQGGLDYVPQHDSNTQLPNDLPLLGGVLHDTRYIWQAKGPALEVRNTKTGSKVGAWFFGGILKDSNTKIVCVEEIQRPNGRISLLAVGIECTISGGIICIFDVFSSKVIRAIQIKEKISSLHIIDPGIEDLNLPGPLRNFDGILALGTVGGDVILIDICRQICEESLHSPSKRDELNPSQLVLLTSKHMPKIEHYKERSMREGNHLGIHLNAVVDNRTEHFVLKGPKDDDRIHVNKEEVLTSAIYYCPQLTSLLVGYNFGAFQLWDLTTLKLVYTSPVCDEHFPITDFALQEPTDDPRAFCYVWVSYSNTDLFQSGLPFAVMYSLCYESKEYHEGYGYLYQDFNYCNIRFQMELGHSEEHRGGALPKGGHCLGIQPITKLSASKESFTRSTAGDTLALCAISWTVWYSKTDTQTCTLVFDLNQWYKEQMPTFTKWKDCNNYILRANLTDLIILNGHKPAPVLNVFLDPKSLTQFVGVQRLEEHFFPTSLSFNLWILRENDVILMLDQGLQRNLLTQIESAGPLCLIRPTDVCRQALTIGLSPLFMDVLPHRVLSVETQREILLNIALEHQLIGWLCKCGSEWANGSFSSAGCSLDFLINWAYERAVVLKTNCDKYCAPLFDYSQSRLDSNTSILLNSCTRQINTLCVLYKHIVGKLHSFVTCMDVVKEHWTGLEMISVYYEVLQWLVNVGLLPECHPSTYPRPDNSERISAPYPVQELTEYYTGKRAGLRLLSKDTFETSDSLLFIDNLIDRKCGGSKLQKQWQEDGGSGLYPPPSLQSLIRTYLVEGAGISHKHSLVIYLFLDLAMALDQSMYSSVVTHLIKFPAVFKVSPSIIKITQAFWQLDHGDFTTAMEQLLDPFVLGEDLSPWHHTIALRSLLLHKQPNFALLYMQVRKPPISDETDVLTAISLFVANNMLDEAFYFKKQHRNNNDEKLLKHLFEECSKNDLLHLVLYKCLNDDEEKTFFDYLKSVENPTSDDLQIFYYLLRSRFIEAIDTHSSVRRKGPNRQGLVGQSLASKTDQIVKIFKTLLPDVNRNLVDYIRKERMNLWKEVQRPTPMSVFVHNTSEQVRYKSNLIHAALAKAKETFRNGLNESYRKELVTEETPFLRTPTVSRNETRIITPIIIPRIIDTNDQDEETAPTPSKRLRLSPRMSTTSPRSPLKTNAQALMLTPIVKRKISMQQDKSSQSFSNISLCTPQSILKVRHLVQRRDSITDDTMTDEDGDGQARNDPLLQSTSLRLQPRSSLSRTPKQQHVQFDEATRFSSSISDHSARQSENSLLADLSKRRSTLSSKDLSSMMTDEAEDVSDEVFYSPDSSANNLEEEEKENGELGDEEAVEEVKVEVKIDLSPEKKGIEVAEEKEEIAERLIASPRARRSYKRSLGEMSPTRSSPRLSKIYTKKPEEEQNQSSAIESPISVKTTPSNDSMSTDSLSPKPRALPKVKGRKSLSRQVLEHNTFSKMMNPVLKEETKSFSKTEKVTVTESSPRKSKTTTTESKLELTDTAATDKNTPTTRRSHSFRSSITKKQFSEETLDSDTSMDLSYQEDYKETELSESLQEYIDDLMSSTRKKPKSNEHTTELSRIQLEFGEEEQKEKESPEDQPQIVEDLPRQVPSSFAPVPVENPPEKQEEAAALEDIVVADAGMENPQEEQEEAAATEDLIFVDPLEALGVEKPPEEQEEAAATEDLIVVDSSEGVEVWNAHQPKLTDLTPLQVEQVESTEAHEDPYDDYKEEESFNELEENIFGLTEDDSVRSQSRRSVSESADSASYCLPISEVAFIEEKSRSASPKGDSGKPHDPKDVVVISSDEDETDSTSGRSSTEKSDDTDGTDEEMHLHVSFEDNIDEDASRNSAYSKTTEEYRDDEDEFAEMVADEEIREAVEGICNKEDGKGFGMVDGRRNEVIETVEGNVEEADEKVEENVDLRQIEGNSGEKIDVAEERTEGNGNLHQTEDKSGERIEDAEEKNEGNEDFNQIGDKGEEKIEEAEKMVETDENNIVAIIGSVTDHSKVDQSTNTTVLPKKNITKLAGKMQEEESSSKIDHSTNTTVVPEETAMKIYRSKTKKTSEGQTTSSSDTTEGETFRKEIVTVQIHAPITSSEDKRDAPPPKRVTRRSLSSAPIIDLAEEAKPIAKKKELAVAGRRTRRALSVSDTSRTATENDTIDCDPNTSIKIIEDSSVAVKLTLRKKRSASVDEIRTFSRQKTHKSNKPTDEDQRESSTERKAQSVSQMPVISEEENADAKNKGNRRARSVVDTYATSRRLTRRQASIVKDVTNTTVEKEEDGRPKISIDLEEIDPINLLDKGSFEGKPDPDENKVYEPSSPSTSTTSVQKKRRSRSNSVLSEISVSPSEKLPATPKRGGRSTRSQTKSPVPSGVSTRSRKHSETSSVKSEHSETSTPPKRTRKKKLDGDEVGSSARSTRSRTASVSSVKSGYGNSPRKVVRARRLVSAKSDLPEITEEKVPENVDAESTQSNKRQTRRKKMP